MKIETWKRNLYATWLAQFVAIFGMGLVVPFLPFFVRELGVVSEAGVVRWSGFVFAGPFIVSFFLTPFWGTFGDRFGRKLNAVRAIIGLGVSQFLISFSADVYQLFIFRLVQGAISGFVPAALAFISAETPVERKGYAIGVLQTATSAGQLAGPIVGGILADLIDYRKIFEITGLLCFASAFLFILGTKEKMKGSNRGGQLENIFKNYRYALVENSSIRISLILIFISQTSIFFVQPIFALFIESIVPDPRYVSSAAGLVFSTAAAFTIVSAPWWGRKSDVGRSAFRKNLSVAMFGAGVTLLLQGASGSVFEVAVFRSIFGLFLGGIVPVIYSFISKNTDTERQGGVMGIASSFTILANVTGPVLGGNFAAFAGLRGCFFLAGAMLSVASIMVLKLLKRN